jgi:AcrR family transcriptional regulator
MDRDEPLDSRERLVDAAVELAIEHYDTDLELRDVFSYLTPGSVAARAGLSRALLYHHWSDPGVGPDAFSAFLVEVADRLRARSSVPQDYEQIAAHLDGPSDVLLAMCDHELDRPEGLRSAWWRATQSLNLHGVVATDTGSHVIGRMAGVYELLGAHFGLEPLDPLDWVDIAVAVASAMNGFALTAREMPDRADRRYHWSPRTPLEHSSDGWTLLSIIVESIVLGMVGEVGRSSAAPTQPSVPLQSEVRANTPSDSDST